MLNAVLARTPGQPARPGRRGDRGGRRLSELRCDPIPAPYCYSQEIVTPYLSPAFETQEL